MSRIDPTAAPSSPQMMPSATGIPMVPAKAVPWLLVLTSIASAVQFMDGVPNILVKLSTIILAVAVPLGLASPGLRR